MKLIFSKSTSAILLLAMSVMFSCSKDDDPKPSKAQLLSKQWVLTAATVNGDDMFSSIPDCIKDDLYIYGVDGTFIHDEGASKCNTDDPQIIAAGTWTVAENDILEINYPDASQELYTIVQLSKSTLVLSISEQGENSIMMQFTFTPTN